MTENKEKIKSGAVDIDDDERYITLEFDDGNDIECEILGIFEVKGKEYIALLPDDGTDDVYLYGYMEYGETEFEIIDIEDDKEFEAVAAEFDRLTMEEIIDTEE